MARFREINAGLKSLEAPDENQPQKRKLDDSDEASGVENVKKVAASKLSMFAFENS